MQRFSLFLIGLLLLPFSALATSGGPLYDQIKSIVEQEISVPAVDPEVTAFIRAIFRKQLTEEGIAAADIERRVPRSEDISAILRDEWTDVCGRLEGRDGPATRPGCMEIVTTVRRLADAEMRVRRLGRLLQTEASGYELPISDLPGRSAQMSQDLRGILSIWGAGDGGVAVSQSGTTVRTVSLTPRIDANPSLYQQLINDIAAAFTSLAPEEQIGAVWRYQYGVRLVRGERAPQFPAPYSYTPQDSGAGTERQFLFHRWNQNPDLEGKLMAVWQDIMGLWADPLLFSPPLEPDEIALLVFPEVLQDLLPPNVLLWARLDGNYEQMHPMGDIGLQWHIPLQPVLPSLVSGNEPILGGRYPPEPVRQVESGSTLVSVPVDGEGLCTSPTGMRGYLCRPIDPPMVGEQCPAPDDLPPDAIALTFCEEEDEDRRFTAAGADVCREIVYRTPDVPSVAVQKACQLTIQCAPDCATPDNVSAMTFFKDAGGSVSICLQEQSPDILNTYLLYHELVHAQYFCSLPPGTKLYQDVPDGAAPEVKARIWEANDTICCEHEGTAYRAQCDLMERDGVFQAAGGVWDGIVLNAETCAEVWTQYSCKLRDGGKGCYLSRPYTDSFVQKIITLSDNPANVPTSCSALVSAVDGQRNITDPRVAGFVDAIEGSTGVCTPGDVSRYGSRIGSHLCYIGQCVEQSLETHRLTPGRTPATVADGVAPWDDPVTGTPLGTLLMHPPLTLTRFPSYRPELLIRTMETALCQAQGMPPRTPPILCALSLQRQLGLEQSTGFAGVLGLLQQKKEQQVTALDLLSLSPALGARMGTELYARYLEESSRSFASLLHTAADLLAEMTTIRFPAQMCPIGPGLPSPAR